MLSHSRYRRFVQLSCLVVLRSGFSGVEDEKEASEPNPPYGGCAISSKFPLEGPKYLATLKFVPFPKREFVKRINAIAAYA